MSDFRVRYGHAFGPYGTASAVSGAMRLGGIDDATPEVTDGAFFVTGNTGATAITYFDVLGPGGVVSTGHNGKWIRILVNDANTTFVNGGQLFLTGSGGAIGTGQFVEFVYFNSGWYETNRSLNNQANLATRTIAGTVAPDVTGVSLMIVNNTFATTIIGLSGGVPGQVVMVCKAVAAAGTTLTVQGAANFMLAGTTAFVANASGVYQFVCDAGSRFRQLGPVIMP